MQFIFESEALLEYDEAAAYLEKEQVDLGVRFTFEVESAIAQIIEAPERWPFFEDDVRRCLTHTFPYAILYTVEKDYVLILAVMHCSRKPGYWRDRRV